MMSVLSKFNIVATGPEDAQPMLFAHGFGCDQHMWRLVAPAFADEYRVILFDYIGAGGSDSSAYDSRRYDSLQGYADDVVEIGPGGGDGGGRLVFQGPPADLWRAGTASGIGFSAGARRQRAQRHLGAFG